MKSLCKVVAALCLATVCAGFCYAHLTAEQGFVIVEKTFVEVVHSGDTFWNICEHWYNAENEGVCFDEFVFNQRQNNEKYFANGRALQPGDKLTFVCKVKIAK